MIAVVVDTADELRGSEEPAIVFAQTAAERAAEHLVALARFGELGFHGRPKLVDDAEAFPEVGERVGRGVELVDQRIDGVGREGAERVFVRRVGEQGIGGARGYLGQIGLFVAASDRFIGEFNGPIVVGT